MNRSLLLLLCLVSPAWLGGARAAPLLAAKPANILLVIVDDLGWRDLACYGSPVYETPAIDRLAAEGMRFTDAYVAYPRCVPSRYSLYRGQVPQRVQGAFSSIVPGEINLAQALKQAGGYRTFFAGKWHLSKVPAEEPQARGFDVNIAGGAAGAVASHFAPYNRPRVDKSSEPVSPLVGLDDAPKGEYLADRLTRETDRFIRAHVESGAAGPFFAVLAHYGVHTPLQAPVEDIARFKKKIVGLTFNGSNYLDRDETTKAHQDNATYAAMVFSVDRSISTLMATLQELELERDTIVIVTSDNGGLSNRGKTNKRELATSNLPLRAGKGHLYEGGVRVPFIVRWPQVVPAASVSSAVITLTDIYPTLLAAGNLPLHPEQHIDGENFLPALRGEAFERGPIVWQNTNPRPDRTGDYASSAMREGKWKVIVFHDDQRTELYDLNADLGENHDLALTRPEKAREMREQLFTLLKNSGAYLPGTDLAEWRKSKGPGSSPRSQAD